MTKILKKSLRLEANTIQRKGAQAKTTETQSRDKMQQLQKDTMYKLQMPKPNRNDCKNSKQTKLLVQGARSTAQKSQITVET